MHAANARHLGPAVGLGLLLLPGLGDCPAGAAPAAPSPPNIVLMVADDLGMDVGCYGGSVVETPNVDRLAGEGLLFERAYVTAAVCCPSRSTIYTGLYPHTNGMYGFVGDTSLHEWVRVLPEFLHLAGYWTGACGKIHVDPPERFKWSVPVQPLVRGRLNETAGIVTGLLESAAASGRPFFVMVNPADPHLGKIAGEEVPVSLPSVARQDLRPRRYHFELPKARHALMRYCHGLPRLDWIVGRVLGELDRLGVADDTLVIFISDHGEPQEGAKRTLYEPGIRVPMILRWPGVIRPGSRFDGLTGSIDILPTILDLAGLEPPGSLPGRSLRPLFANPETPSDWRDAIFATHTYSNGGRYYPMRAVITADWKYICNLRPDVDFPSKQVRSADVVRSAGHDRNLFLARRLIRRPAEELYDLRNDPDEFVNLADAPPHAERKAKLRSRLRHFMEQTDDPLLVLWDRAPGDPDPFAPAETVDGPWTPRWLSDEAAAVLGGD